MSRRPVWEEIYKRFDPYRPPQNPAWRAERKRSPASEIVALMSMPIGDHRALVSGTIGTGKSTEMLRIAEECSRDDFVVVLDLQRHFGQIINDENALLNVSSWEVVFLAGLSVLRAANDLLPYPVPEEYVKNLSCAWEQLASATETPRPGAQVDAGSLAKSMIVLASASLPLLGVPASAAATVGLKLLEAAAGATKWNLPIGQAAKRKPDQDSEVQSLLGAVNQIIGYVQTKARRVMLLIDGLDRIDDIKRAEDLFIRSELIQQLACRLVVSGPFALRSHPAAVAVPRFSKNRALVNEPVMAKNTPHEYGPGVSFFCELYLRRTDDLGVPDLVSTAQLERLAYYSGGRARDFVKSIQMLAEQGWLHDAPQATDALIDRVLDETRRLLETGLDTGHIEALERIAKDPQHRLSDNTKARELLRYGQLLPYPNESEWYYPHPLLTLHLVKTSPTGSSG